MNDHTGSLPPSTIPDAALFYAEVGHTVFPALPDKKKSYKSKKHSNGVNWGATSDPEEIQADFKKWPDANIGLPTGIETGFFITVTDTLEGHKIDGTASFAGLQKKYGPLPETRTARSPSGSRHYYFKNPPNIEIKNSSSEIAPGVDVRGEGGMVIAPPSIRPGKGQYEWVKWVPIADAPQWLIELCRKKKEPIRNKIKHEATIDNSPLAAAVNALQNPNLCWDEWNQIGMALWRATNGDDSGKALWYSFSEKSNKYDADETEARWEHYATSPPTQIGAGTIFYKADQDTPGWLSAYLKQHFEFNDKDRPSSQSQKNITTALALLGITLKHDVFPDRKIVVGLKGYDHLDDEALEELWLLVDQTFRFRPTLELFRIVVSNVAHHNAFHPVRDYLNGLKWDGVPRLDRWLIDYGKAKDTPYVRAVGAITLIAGVRRVRQPGVKFDEMLILESAQGLDKSNVLKILAVKTEWFSDDLPLNADGKRVIEQTRGRWIIEAAEMSGLRKTEVDHLKAMLSRWADRARLSYGRLPTEKSREFIIIGTTNDEVYLKDLTGNRRFWPVFVKFDIEKLAQNRDQLWAEAAAREAAGESIRLDAKLWAEAAGEQSERTVKEPWVDILASLLGDRKGKLLAADAWILVNLTQGQQTQEHNKRMGSAMRMLGWEHGQLRFDRHPQSCYYKGDSRSALDRILVQRHREGVWVGYEGEKPPM